MKFTPKIKIIIKDENEKTIIIKLSWKCKVYINFNSVDISAYISF